MSVSSVSDIFFTHTSNSQQVVSFSNTGASRLTEEVGILNGDKRYLKYGGTGTEM